MIDQIKIDRPTFRQSELGGGLVLRYEQLCVHREPCGADEANLFFIV